MHDITVMSSCIANSYGRSSIDSIDWMLNCFDIALLSANESLVMGIHAQWCSIGNILSWISAALCYSWVEQENLANAKVNARQHCVSLSCLCNSLTQIEWVARLLLPPKHAKSRKFRENSTLQQFKVIQSHRSWCQWKAHMWLPISH